MSGFNWVEARYDCTAESEFKKLADAVVEDIKARIGQDESIKHDLEYRPCDANKFVVRKHGSHEIVFERTGETINISYVHQSGTERRLLAVTVGMNEQGQCTLKNGNKELLPWQVRRIALEETLFGSQ